MKDGTNQGKPTPTTAKTNSWSTMSFSYMNKSTFYEKAAPTPFSLPPLCPQLVKLS